MKIAITFDVSNDQREAIGALTGDGKSSYGDTKIWIKTVVDSWLQDVVYEKEQRDEQEGVERDQDR